jgi:vacuolar-type H+-ATPase subunit C/Vma6
VRRLESAVSLGALAHELEGTAYGRFLPPRAEDSRAVETSVLRSIADRFATLARWAGPRGDQLAVVFLEQDVHAVRDLMRGALGGLGPEQRLVGALPTPTLPRKALRVLAGVGTPTGVAATLAAWGHPLGHALVREADDALSDPFQMEVALGRSLGALAPRAARGGGRHVRDFVAESVDGHNVVTAILLAGARSEGVEAEMFVEGGRSLGLDGFLMAAEAPDHAEAVRGLGDYLRGTLFAEALADSAASSAALSSAILSARIHALRTKARLEPVSALPVLHFVLALCREARKVRRTLWRAALSRRVAA